MSHNSQRDKYGQKFINIFCLSTHSIWLQNLPFSRIFSQNVMSFRQTIDGITKFRTSLIISDPQIDGKTWNIHQKRGWKVNRQSTNGQGFVHIVHIFSLVIQLHSARFTFQPPFMVKIWCFSSIWGPIIIKLYLNFIFPSSIWPKNITFWHKVSAKGWIGQSAI